MKRFRQVTLLLFIWACMTTSLALGFQCNVCHSKNPALVAMHKAVQAKEIGCFDCHRVGEKLLGKAPAKDRDSLLARRASDPLCIQCHVKN